ncbi:YfcC family protein, partial [Xanthomonas citri pv. citri]|nr:YfcC family protein [Xanthomonas citri pv. citri]
VSGPVFVLSLLIVFFLLGFIVPSSSGLAVLALPIMAPLGDTAGVSRATVLCAYQWGQYAMLFLAPTGLVMATLQMLDIKYSHWLKFVWPLVVFVLVYGGILLVLQTVV